MDDHQALVRAHDYITTFTGIRVCPPDLLPHEVQIEDIAHALSNSCRFGGHVRDWWSVGLHSILVANLLRSWGESPDVQYAGLLHDATEAYITDLPSPIKWKIPGFKTFELRLAVSIYKALGLPHPDHEVWQKVKKADIVALHLEAGTLFYGVPRWVQTQSLSDRACMREIPARTREVPMSGKAAFLARYRDLRERVMEVAPEGS